MGTTYTMDVDFYADLRNQGNSLKLDVMHTSTTNSSCNTSRKPTTDDIDPNDSGPNLTFWVTSITALIHQRHNYPATVRI